MRIRSPVSQLQLIHTQRQQYERQLDQRLDAPTQLRAHDVIAG
jgi:hypothetical protein